MKFFISLFYCTIFSFLFLYNLVSAQHVQWVTVEGMASMENVTKEEARRLAIEDAMRKAVEEVVGVDILAETLVINFITCSDVIRAIPYGKVIDKEIIEEGVKEIRHEGKTTLSLIYRVKMRARVIKEKGDLDPYFKVEATVNRDTFKEGDDILIKVKSTRDCHINIFCILEDEKVIILIPNRYRKENFIKANEVFLFPDESDQRRGIRLKAHQLQGRKVTTETIYLLCLKQSISFDPAKFQEGIYGIYDGKTAFINELIKEIIEIPLSERGETFVQYLIK